MKNKKVYYTIVILLIAGAIVYAVSNIKNKSLKEQLTPEVSLTVTHIKNISSEHITMQTKLILSNPLPFEVNTTNINYQVSINGTQVLNNRYTEPITIATNGKSSLDLPMEIDVKPLQHALKELEEKKADSAEYTVTAQMEVDVPIAGEHQFDVNKTWKLPALRSIKVGIEDLNVKKIEWKKSSMVVSLKVENNNAFPIKMKDATYKVTLEDDYVMAGALEGITAIEAKSTSVIPMELDIRNSKAGKLAWKALFDKDETAVKIDFNSTLLSENEMLNNSTMAMRTSGTLSDLKNIPFFPEEK